MKKKIIYLFVLACIGMAGCEENDKMVFDAKASIYFQLSDTYGQTNLDSLIYSFATGNKTVDTVDLKVKVMGLPVDRDRMFSVNIVEEMTTARQGDHYEPIQAQYVFPANAITASVPVVVYNTDPLLRDGSVRIALSVVPSDDFDLGLQEKQVAKLIITDQLTVPGAWSSVLKYFFGDYNRTKHKIFRELYGIDFPETSAEVFKAYGLWKSYGTLLNDYFAANYPIYDNNGEIVEPWL